MTPQQTAIQTMLRILGNPSGAFSYQHKALMIHGAYLMTDYKQRTDDLSEIWDTAHALGYGPHSDLTGGE